MPHPTENQASHGTNCSTKLGVLGDAVDAIGNLGFCTAVFKLCFPSLPSTAILALGICTTAFFAISSAFCHYKFNHNHEKKPSSETQHLLDEGEDTDAEQGVAAADHTQSEEEASKVSSFLHLLALTGDAGAHTITRAVPIVYACGAIFAELRRGYNILVHAAALLLGAVASLAEIRNCRHTLNEGRESDADHHSHKNHQHLPDWQTIVGILGDALEASGIFAFCTEVFKLGFNTETEEKSFIPQLSWPEFSFAIAVTIPAAAGAAYCHYHRNLNHQCSHSHQAPADDTGRSPLRQTQYPILAADAVFHVVGRAAAIVYTFNTISGGLNREQNRAIYGAALCLGAISSLADCNTCRQTLRQANHHAQEATPWAGDQQDSPEHRSVSSEP